MAEEWDEEWDEEEESDWETDPANTPHAVPAQRKPYPGASSKKRRKMQYADRLRTLLRAYTKVLILNIDNVGSNQMQKVRLSLRNKAILLMGRNSIIRRIIREEMKANPKLKALHDLINGNVGLCFSNNDLSKVRKYITKNKVPASAKQDTIASDDVWVPPGSTGLDPGQTGFFQALNIATKINRGAIEIISDVHLIKPGDKVTASHVVLLEKLGIRPFSFGITVPTVYEDGDVYEASVLDLDEDTLLSKFHFAARFVAAMSLAIGVPTEASLIHNIAHGYRLCLALSVATEYTFEESKIFKEMIANPDAFKSADAEEEEEEEEKEESEEEESEESEGGGMFGDDSE